MDSKDSWKAVGRSYGKTLDNTGELCGGIEGCARRGGAVRWDITGACDEEFNLLVCISEM